MNTELTKSAKKSLAIIYKDYCQRLKEGQAKNQAIQFKEKPDGVSDDLKELKHAGFVNVDILGNFELTDHAVIFMETKTVETIKEWLSFGAQFIP